MVKIRQIVSKTKVKKYLKKIAGIHQNQTFNLRTFVQNLRLRYGPYIWKRKISTLDLVSAMENMGMKRGSNIFIHCNWNEFYNYTGNEKELIDEILNVIGKEGTLIMPAFPILRKGKIFSIRKSVTGAGLLAEEFRKYPGVKRSINVQHSVCALGPQADFLISEHSKCETCWDEKSPYFKLSKIGAIVFNFGQQKYSVGTIAHCVESILRKEVPYFENFYQKELTSHKYIDLDNTIKEYFCYDLRPDLHRTNKFFGLKYICKKYFDKTYHKYVQISNLIISVAYAEKVVPKMIELGRKGIIVYKTPSKKGYKFN